jgi:hypothetical protein
MPTLDDRTSIASHRLRKHIITQITVIEHLDLISRALILLLVSIFG